MDKIFLRVNQSQSYIGEQVLYQTLHSGDEAFFRDNRELMEILSRDEKHRLDLSLRLHSIGKKRRAIIFRNSLPAQESLPSWSEPVFCNPEGLTVRGLYHPLLKDPVCNDFSLAGRAVLTGANASGKSTFMKALAINVLLAQTINTCCCHSVSLPMLKVMTSMAIRDDVVTGESYYVREVRYLKRMLDEMTKSITTFCVIDEILKGTNQKERLAASQAVLKYLAEFPAYCIIATHDMELVEKLKELYEPYYFVSKIEDINVTFDYRIRKGLGGESNALALLKAFDFPDKVVQDAYCLIE